VNVSRVLAVQEGDTVRAFQGFLSEFWTLHRLEALLAPVDLPDHPRVSARVIRDPAELATVNPFIPLMHSNAASLAWQFIRNEKAKRMAVLLRPCELRALVELEKRAGFSASPQDLEQDAVDGKFIALIGVDCLGTFLPDSEEATSLEDATCDTLSNAAQGGLKPQRFRTACQVCDWPAPRGADLAIGTIGVDNDQHLLLISADETTDEYLGLGSFNLEPADESLVSRRETVVGAIADTRAGLRRTLIEELGGDRRFSDLGSFLAWFASCDLCGRCLNACPLYNGELSGLFGKPRPDHAEYSPLAELVLLSRWIASCSGCGMCEETCVQDVPLMLLISALSHRIRSEMNYNAGDPAQPVPWKPIPWRNI
jgi:formate dehydrogenase (coenzyme F420) beta subunit